jgi:TRAP-type C4-dicarboxylate transport system permease small subunit
MSNARDNLARPAEPRESAIAATLRWIYAGAAVLGGGCVVAILLCVTWQMVARALGVLAAGFDEFAAYALAGAAFLALPYTLKEGAHIRVTFLLGRIHNPRLRLYMEIFCLAAATLVGLYLAWTSVLFVWNSYVLNDMATTYYATPLWIPRLVMPIGIGVLLIAIVEELVNCIRGRLPDYVRLEAPEI